jgi:ppGpp synthetase/RelA/SpoT-type nucleotidyltranferase
MADRREFRPGSEAAVDYAGFARWYDMYRADVLDPALVVAEVALGGVLNDALSDRDLARIRRPVGRVKAKPRVWRKLGKPRYAGRVGTVHDIPDVLDDLIGVRLTCTNRRDIDVVREVLDALPTADDGGTELWLDPASERDYLDVPRPSGYRGWHVNLGIGLDVDGVRRPVTCELQVRTLFQDGWGELTHEDSYKKDGDLPPLVEVLSRRMADLLATLDDIAEDLRDELDRLDEAAVVGSPNSEPLTRGTTGGSSEQSIDASAHLETRWRNLDRPLDLASLAWEVQREYGAEISDDWFGFGTFKRFLASAAPGAEITAGRHAYLLPADIAPDDAAAEDVFIEIDDQMISVQEEARTSDIPSIARALHRVDRTFPLLPSDRWTRLFDHLAEAWHRAGPQPPTDQLIRRLVQSTCDRSAASGTSLARRHVEAVVRDLVTEGDGTPQAARELADDYVTLAQHRLVELRLIGSRNRTARAALRQWIVPSTR